MIAALYILFYLLTYLHTYMYRNDAAVSGTSPRYLIWLFHQLLMTDAAMQGRNAAVAELFGKINGC